MEVVRRRIKVTKNQLIGSGGYQKVYRISQRRVVKVPRSIYGKKRQKAILEDEIIGAKTLNFALPVLEVVDVQLPNGNIVRGTIRRYIPKKIKYGYKSYDQFEDFKDNNDLSNVWDSHEDNFRIDSKGNFWRIDTQTDKILRYV